MIFVMWFIKRAKKTSVRHLIALKLVPLKKEYFCRHLLLQSRSQSWHNHHYGDQVKENPYIAVSHCSPDFLGSHTEVLLIIPFQNLLWKLNKTDQLTNISIKASHTEVLLIPFQQLPWKLNQTDQPWTDKYYYKAQRQQRGLEIPNWTDENLFELWAFGRRPTQLNN